MASERRLALLLAAGWLLLPRLALAEPGPAAAMARLVEAMRARDLDALRRLLPEQGSLTLTGTIEQPYRRVKIDAARLRSDLDAKQGFYETLFGFQGDDSWRDVFERTGFAAWRARPGLRFVPPGREHDDGRHFVRWRREGARWVLAEIGMPDA